MGAETNWVRNVLAAGECGIRWKGQEYLVNRPELVRPALVLPRVGPIQRAILRGIGIDNFLELHR